MCTAQAKNLTPNTYDGVVIGCPRCGDYQITGTVFDQLLRLAVAERTKALQRAIERASPGARPTISTTCL
jgi:hypothetical protein